MRETFMSKSFYNNFYYKSTRFAQKRVKHAICPLHWLNNSMKNLGTCFVNFLILNFKPYRIENGQQIKVRSEVLKLSSHEKTCLLFLRFRPLIFILTCVVLFGCFETLSNILSKTLMKFFSVNFQNELKKRLFLTIYPSRKK